MNAFIQTILRFIGNWFFNSICLYACSKWINGITLTPSADVPVYILVMELGLILTLMNVLLRPILLHLLLPLNGLTIGFLSLIINGFFIFLLSRFSASFSVANIWVGVLATFVFAVLNIILQILIPIDDDMTFYSVISKKIRTGKEGKSNEKGIVMLEIDGLSYPRLMKAVDKGYMPFLKSLLDSGEYTVRPYDCGVPSQTSSCQAGIMYGRNNNICAFRWYDKAKRKVYSSNNPGNAQDIEKMLFPDSKPSGILNKGLSVNNIISGNAEESILTISQLFPKSREEQEKRNRDLYLLSIRPYLLTKSLVLTLFDAFSEVISYCWDCIRGKEPRINRLHKFYPIVRGATNVLLRDISTAMVADAVFSGRKAMYTTFIGYDEIAHHSGPDSTSAANSLKGIDASIRKIFEAASISEARPYEIVILSDHGQTFGATFLQRYQTTLGDYIKSLAVKHSLLGKALRVVSLDKDEDNAANVMAILKSLSNSGPDALTKKAAEALGNAVADKDVEEAVKSAENEANDILVLASGNLVNAYFSVSDKRMTYDEITAAYPGMVEEMINHPGIGLILVHTDEGPIAIGKNGQRNLHTGSITGADPLEMYNDVDKRAKQLRYLADFPNGGDLVIISPVYEDGTVAAYEELIGSHGGLGGQQTDPFLMYSSKFHVDDEIINANQVYPVLQRIKNSPVTVSSLPKDEKSKNVTSIGALWKQIKNTKHWVPTLVRSLYFSSDAYKNLVSDPTYNGPAILIGLISFFCSWIAMNSNFKFRFSPLANFVMLILTYGVVLLAGYLALIIMRGKREFRKFCRAFLFTSYWAILSLLVLTRQAQNIWLVVVLLLLVNSLVSSVYHAGELKRQYFVPLYVVLLVLIPLIAVGLLAIYKFFTYGRAG